MANWDRIAGSTDWEELWDSPEVRARLERYGTELLKNENADKARGALEMAHYLQTLPGYEMHRRRQTPIERVPIRGWLMQILGKTLTDVFGRAPKKGVKVV